jgi:peptidylprolyl isomerase
MKTALIVIGFVILGAALAYVAIDAPDGDGGKVGEQITTPSGLKYIDKVIGSGRAAKVGDVVSVHYTGTFEDGTVFDSSRKRDEPYRIVLGKSNVIAGWHEGIAGMKEGGKRNLIIPPDLAYGKQGRDGIPPNATLRFEIEVVKIK